MKTTKYRNEFKAMLLASGRKKKWLQEKMGMNKITFYRAIHKDTLNSEQKQKIAKLLSI